MTRPSLPRRSIPREFVSAPILRILGRICADLGVRVGKALAQARAAKTKPDGKSMTQKDLATAVNAKPQDVSRSGPPGPDSPAGHGRQPPITRRITGQYRVLTDECRSPISSLEKQCPISNSWAKSSGSSVSNCVVRLR